MLKMLKPNIADTKDSEVDVNNEVEIDENNDDIEKNKMEDTVTEGLEGKVKDSHGNPNISMPIKVQNV